MRGGGSDTKKAAVKDEGLEAAAATAWPGGGSDSEWSERGSSSSAIT
jgi:hypothetical protein